MLSQDTSPDYGNSIAVIGMSCRFPHAKTPEDYWRLLHDGVECVTEITEEDLLAAGLNPEIMRHPNFVKRQVVLDDIDRFDASFFGYFPRDAEILDPQQRLMLECSWEALESAGYIPGKCKQVIGIYAGVDMSQYLFNLYSNREIMESVGIFQINLANDKDHVTTRVAYKLNLSGPAVTVQTTCSTSLVAISQACQSLLNYQCDIALAGGTAISLPQRVGYVYQEGGIASPDGFCRAFDARAQGTIGGSGTGVVVLKRMEEALEDGDEIHAVIKGFAINNDGALKVGYTAPSVEGQSEAIAMAQAMAEVDPETITYIEAHGTATPLGDPIEVRALTEVFRASTSKTNYCGIGSVKTNFGHLNSAAGVAGFMKVVLSLKNKMIPPSLHFETPNPNIDFTSSPFYVVNQLKQWESEGTPRRAGVSSFGIGGTNAHIVLEEAPDQTNYSDSRDWLLIPFSAKTEKALDRLVAKFARFLSSHSVINLADLAFTLQVGRKDFAHRKLALASKAGIKQLGEQLQQSQLSYQLTSTEEEKNIVFMFSGQGSQYINMSRELYLNEPFFREQVDRCCDLLEAHTGRNFRDLLYPPEAEEKAAEAALNQTENTQPALFIIEYALAQLWMSWGVRPAAMVGHSIGEYVAACISGVFSLEDALQIVAERGKLMQQVAAGSMLSVPLPEAELLSVLSPELSIGVINSPDITVVSGPEKAIIAFKEKMDSEGHKGQILKTSHAFHSKMFDPIIASFAELVGRYERSAPDIPFVSNKSGTWIQVDEATNPNYWAMHLRQTVRFAENIKTLSETPNAIFLEVGPGTTLQRLAQHMLQAEESKVVLSSLPHPKDPTAGDKFLLHQLGQLWLNGVPIDWDGFYAHERRRRIKLPTYPFESHRYWIDPSTTAESVGSSQRLDMDKWFYLPKWEPESNGSYSQPDESLLGKQQQWLVFVDQRGYSDQFIAHLQKNPEAQIVIVRQANAFAQISPEEYTLNSRVKSDFKKLFEALEIHQRLPDIILHFWNINYLDQPLVTSATTIKDTGFFSLLYLAQYLSASSSGKKCAIYLFTKELYRVNANDQLHPGQALSVGAGKVIRQELPNILFQNIDLNGSLNESNTLENILKDIAANPHESGKDLITAWRNGKKWKLQYRQAPIKEVNQLKLRLRPGGVYLITGGMGGIGTVIAKYLAIRKRATLILLSRTEIPPREAWSDYLNEHPTSDRTAQKIRRIKDMESFGAKVFIVKGSVTDKKAMKKLARLIQSRFGKLHGIIHSAGVAGGGIISLKNENDALKVMAPKVDGTLILQEIFGRKDLDFFILCSSLSSILGGFGQVDYCAANAFQDAFAQKFAGEATYYLSINWDTWGETGMAVNTEVPDDMKQWQEEGLKRGIKNLEGMKLMEHLMASNQPQIATSTTLLSRRILGNGHEPVGEPEVKQQEAVPVGKKTTAKHKRPELTVPYLEAGTPTEEKIVFIWQELLGIAPIGIADNFLELGGHSLLAVQLISRLRDAFGVEVSIQDFFEAPTVKALATRFLSAPPALPEDIVESPDAPPEAPAGNTISRVSRDKYRVRLDQDGIQKIPKVFDDKPKND